MGQMVCRTGVQFYIEIHSMASRFSIASLPLIALALTLPSSPLRAQDGSDMAGIDPETGEIVVTAPSLRGEVDTEIPPLIELDEADIAAYGASSIADLVEALEPSSGSSRGRGSARPVFLVNGIRVASFREFRSYPPEALRKVEVLPEEVAQELGFPPDRRVINFILKPDFASREIEVEIGAPDRGGYQSNEQEFTLLRIAESGRLNLNIEHNDTSLLTEDERGIVQTQTDAPPVAGDPDPASARSLVADSRSFEATANWTTASLETGASTSISAGYDHNDSRSLSGLDNVILTAPDGSSAFRTFNADDPLTRSINSDTVSLAGSHARPLGDWQFTSTLDSSFADNRTRIDQQADTSAIETAALAGTLDIDGPLPPLGNANFDEARSRTYSAVGKATLQGRPILLPGGELGVTLDAGYDWSRIESSDTRSLTDTQLTRGITSGGINVAVPITSVRDDFLADVGDLSANFQARVDHFSDFGTLFDWSAGLNWKPVDDLTFSATYVNSEAAPSLAQLGDPLTTSFNVPIFDLTTGQSSLITVVDGGNPALPSESQSDWKLSANWRLPTEANLRLNVDYIDNSSRNVTASFPSLTPAIEAAFADRVTRDADGRLLRLDSRPVAYERTKARRLVIGLTMRGQLGQESGEGERSGGGRGDQRAAVQPAESARPARGEGRDPDRFAKLQATFCATPEGQTPDLTDIPERMLDRLKGEDGQIDPERVAQARERICSADAQSAARPGQTRANAAAPSDGESPPPRERSAAGSARIPSALPGQRGGQNVRYFLNLNHSIELENTILIAEGIPELDQLDGDATSAFGLPRHSTRLEAGLFFGGTGIRVSGQYVGKSRIDGTSNLSIDDLATIDLRVFTDLGELLNKDSGFFKGTRLSLKADNVFDGRRVVRDETGAIPLRYQPLLIDPTGRFIGLELRKLF